MNFPRQKEPPGAPLFFEETLAERRSLIKQSTVGRAQKDDDGLLESAAHCVYSLCICACCGAVTASIVVNSRAEDICETELRGPELFACAPRFESNVIGHDASLRDSCFSSPDPSSERLVMTINSNTD